MHFTVDIPNPLSPELPVLPHPWQVWPQDAASPVMSGFVDLHRLMLCVLTIVFLAFVALMGVILYRFRASRNPRPHKGGGPFLQFAWVGLPVVLLVLIAIPALRQRELILHMPAPDVSVMAVGQNGSWLYSYSDDGDFSYESHMLNPDAAREVHQPYGFAVDAPLVVPVGRTVQVLLTSADVMHAFSVPALGVRSDAVPGEIKSVWFRATKPGIYYGLCPGVCGGETRAMPVAVQVVPVAAYLGWLSWAQKKYTQDDAAPSDAPGDVQ